MSLHISKRAAAELALKLATDFMHRQDVKGWEWRCFGAHPDTIDPGYRGRKIASRWIVLVEYSRNGGELDGPAIIHVDIETGTAKFPVNGEGEGS